ncbi:MAG: hypothetical protein ABS61_05685 [Microbacterium sp. SCN 70-18]|nr:MAG: hypothetical protein ABS61_05685 [Microbacterium sp. SCN 70-18]
MPASCEQREHVLIIDNPRRAQNSKVLGELTGGPLRLCDAPLCFVSAEFDRGAANFDIRMWSSLRDLFDFHLEQLDRLRLGCGRLLAAQLIPLAINRRSDSLPPNLCRSRNDHFAKQHINRHSYNLCPQLLSEGTAG